ncbi:hypothetical protein ACTXT7_017234, partial [Hymenolepis weldensis]
RALRAFQLEDYFALPVPTWANESVVALIAEWETVTNQHDQIAFKESWIDGKSK